MDNNYLQLTGNNPFGSQAKMLLHWDRLNEYMQTGDTSCPIFMEVGLTNRCNESCVWCITENGRDNIHGESLELETLKKFQKEFKELGGKAITYAGQGEPTFYKHFEEATIHAKEMGLELGMMTNGVFKSRYIDLIGKSFQWMRISLDTLDEEKYTNYKGVNGPPVIKKHIQALKDYPIKVGVNVNVGSEYTVQEAKDIVEWIFEDDAVDYLQFRPILPRYYKPDEKDNLEVNDEVWSYLDSLGDHPKLNLSNDKRMDLENQTAFNFRSCEGHFFDPILDATGEVKICTYHPGKLKFSFGNIYEKSFEEIWKGEQRQKAIKFVRGVKYNKVCQVCCKCSEVNKLVDFLTQPEKMVDLNFI